jgi:hypothetical protein
MERSLLEKHLAIAERHVRLGASHLKRQRSVIATYDRLGRNTALSRELLAMFEHLQVEHVAHRDRLLRELRSKPAPPHQRTRMLIPVER